MKPSQQYIEASEYRKTQSGWYVVVLIGIATLSMTSCWITDSHYDFKYEQLRQCGVNE